MTALTRSVHAATTARHEGGGDRRAAVVSRQGLSPLAARDSSQVTGVVVEILGEHAVALELENTGAGAFREEIVVHGRPGWTRDLQAGDRMHATGEWDLADWHQWDATERAHYLAIRGRLEFRVCGVQTLNSSSAAA